MNGNTNLVRHIFKEAPFLAQVLYVFGGLSIFGGMIFCIAFWPKSGRDGYIISFMWLTAGIVQAVFLSTFAKILVYLNCIEINTKKNPEDKVEDEIAPTSSPFTSISNSHQSPIPVKNKDQDDDWYERNMGNE